MSRSPLAYPLTRAVDGDAGGSADLQTDIMRFMAILALCLVAIFALVQSIPLAATPRTTAMTPVPAQPSPDTEVVVDSQPRPEAGRVDTAIAPAPAKAVPLTRPKWVPTFRAAAQSAPVSEQPAAVLTRAPARTEDQAVASRPLAPEQDGFTLRFESDLALTRLVASGVVGLYAIDANRTRRMAVSDSRISFWDASRPGQFHEMDAATVPDPVLAALARAGVETAAVSFGVTLPGKLRRQLDTLLRQHAGGALVIGSDGNLRLDAT